MVRIQMHARGIVLKGVDWSKKAWHPPPKKKSKLQLLETMKILISIGGGGAWYIHVPITSIIICKLPSFAFVFFTCSRNWWVGGCHAHHGGINSFFPLFYTCMWFKKIYVVPKDTLSNHATSLKFDTFHKDIQLISMLI